MTQFGFADFLEETNIDLTRKEQTRLEYLIEDKSGNFYSTTKFIKLYKEKIGEIELGIKKGEIEDTKPLNSARSNGETGAYSIEQNEFLFKIVQRISTRNMDVTRFFRKYGYISDFKRIDKKQFNKVALPDLGLFVDYSKNAQERREAQGDESLPQDPRDIVPIGLVDELFLIQNLSSRVDAKEEYNLAPLLSYFRLYTSESEMGIQDTTYVKLKELLQELVHVAFASNFFIKKKNIKFVELYSMKILTKMASFPKRDFLNAWLTSTSTSEQKTKG